MNFAEKAREIVEQSKRNGEHTECAEAAIDFLIIDVEQALKEAFEAGRQYKESDSLAMLDAGHAYGEALKRIAVLEKALKYYANESRYDWEINFDDDGSGSPKVIIDIDYGERARAALSGAKKE